jgi:hypothetical protein
MPKQACTGPEAPRLRDSRHTEVERLSALSTGRLRPQGSIPGTHFKKDIYYILEHNLCDIMAESI